MQVTRADFLRYTSLATGLAVMALSRSGPAEASASPAGPGEAPPPPGGPDGLLDSQRFRQAVEQGDLSTVKSYLERDPALAGSRDEPPAALPTAAMMGMTAHVKRLLAEDSGRIWECGAHNMPPMWFPAIGGGEADHLEIARLLLDAGADPNAHKRGQTALHWAARGGQMEMAELLISRGARVDAPAKTPEGEKTPLAVALRAEKRDMAELLRRHGAR